MAGPLWNPLHRLKVRRQTFPGEPAKTWLEGSWKKNLSLQVFDTSSGYTADALWPVYHTQCIKARLNCPDKASARGLELQTYSAIIWIGYSKTLLKEPTVTQQNSLPVRVLTVVAFQNFVLFLWETKWEEQKPKQVWYCTDICWTMRRTEIYESLIEFLLRSTNQRKIHLKNTEPGSLSRWDLCDPSGQGFLRSLWWNPLWPRLVKTSRKSFACPSTARDISWLTLEPEGDQNAMNHFASSK